jgi:hypothetical protein
MVRPGAFHTASRCSGAKTMEQAGSWCPPSVPVLFGRRCMSPAYRDRYGGRRLAPSPVKSRSERPCGASPLGSRHRASEPGPMSLARIWLLRHPDGGRTATAVSRRAALPDSPEARAQPAQRACQRIHARTQQGVVAHVAGVRPLETAIDAHRALLDDCVSYA